MNQVAVGAIEHSRELGLRVIASGASPRYRRYRSRSSTLEEEDIITLVKTRENAPLQVEGIEIENDTGWVQTNGVQLYRFEFDWAPRRGRQCLPMSRAKPRLIYPRARYERARRIEFDHKQSRWKKTRRVNNDLIRFR